MSQIVLLCLLRLSWINLSLLALGFAVPAKLVAQIMAEKYVNLSELLAVNLGQKALEPQLSLDGRLMLTSQPKKQRRCIEDIASWMEAFTIFSSVLVSSFPHRQKDRMQSQLLSPLFWKSLASLQPSVP